MLILYHLYIIFKVYLFYSLLFKDCSFNGNICSCGGHTTFLFVNNVSQLHLNIDASGGHNTTN